MNIMPLTIIITTTTIIIITTIVVIVVVIIFINFTSKYSHKWNILKNAKLWDTIYSFKSGYVSNF